jgi:hypothetical protein
MAPASASPQPPYGRSDTASREEPGSDAVHREALESSEPESIRPEGHAPHELAKERCEICGQLSIERHLKQDGRTLILYARRESQKR